MIFQLKDETADFVSLFHTVSSSSFSGICLQLQGSWLSRIFGINFNDPYINLKAISSLLRLEPLSQDLLLLLLECLCYTPWITEAIVTANLQPRFMRRTKLFKKSNSSFKYDPNSFGSQPFQITTKFGWNAP